MATDPNVIAYDGSTRPGASSYRAYVVESTVGSNLRVTVYANRPDMRNEHARPDFGIIINTYMRHQREYFLDNGKPHASRRPHPSGSCALTDLLESENR
jgi:hypothetical protein